MTQEEICARIHNHGLRVSQQRVAIYRYMLNPFHPSAEMVFEALHGTIPSLSLATVYNCLHDFVNAGLLSEIRVENEIVRYDATTEEHGHFKCKCCNRIFDFPVDINRLYDDFVPAGYQIDTATLVVYGTCPECRRSAN